MVENKGLTSAITIAIGLSGLMLTGALGLWAF